MSENNNSKPTPRPEGFGTPSSSPPKVAGAAGDTFEARRTSRVAKDFAKADGDEWQENLAVCEAPNNKLVIRSYYLNKRTGKRVWDEPPSGASKLLPATEEMRRMANLQMQEMQLVLGVFPEDSNNNSNNSKNDRKKSGLFRWKNNNNNSKPGDKNEKTKSGHRIQYKPGSLLAPKPELPRDDTMDPDIQRAISLSLGAACSYDSASSEPRVRAEIWQEDDDAVALAKALSLSTAEAMGSAAVSASASSSSGASTPRRSQSSGRSYSSSPHRQAETEDEILARVLEESRLEAESKSTARKGDEEEKCEVDADLLGMEDLRLHHNIASNGGHSRSSSSSKSPGRKPSQSPKRADRKPSISPKRDSKPAAVTTAATSRRPSSHEHDEMDEKQTMHLALKESRKPSSASPSPKRNALSDEDAMLQLALEASMRESDRISQAQERIAGASVRSGRTVSPMRHSSHSTTSSSSHQRDIASSSEHRRRSAPVSSSTSSHNNNNNNSNSGNNSPRSSLKVHHASPEYESVSPTRSPEPSSSARGTRSSFSVTAARRDMPSLLSASSSGDGIFISPSESETLSSEKAIKGVRGNEVRALRKMAEETSSPTKNGRRKSSSSPRHSVNAIQDEAGLV